MQSSSPTKARSIVHPFLDFWLLGGASVAIWLVLLATGFVRADNAPLENRFLQIGVTFSLLSLICNHPHFMMSYQIGYGRGFRFIGRNWFALVAVPALLILLFGFAFFEWNEAPARGWFVDGSNALFAYIGVGFRLGLQERFGNELMMIGIWTMYLTVGWHYSKQVFGCMMVYGHYDAYRTDQWQRRIIKGSVFSVALLQFAHLYRWQPGADPNYSVQLGAPPNLTRLDLPEGLYQLSIGAVILFFLATLVFVFAKNYRSTRQLPSANFLIPWIAFHIWWIPVFQIPEFTFLMVPFFHSLQYLPFAYRVGTPRFVANRFYYSKIAAHALAILVIGYFAFEGLPSMLDKLYGTSDHQQAFFFVTAFAVFINVHHFFIDSVTWRLSDPEMRSTLLETRS